MAKIRMSLTLLGVLLIGATVVDEDLNAIVERLGEIYSALTSLAASPQSCPNKGSDGTMGGLAATTMLLAVDAGPDGSPTTPNSEYEEIGCPVLGQPPSGKRYILIKNNCNHPVWLGFYSPFVSAVPPDNDWEWEPGECKNMQIPAFSKAVRLWARLNCTEDPRDHRLRCVTGYCNTAPGSAACLASGEPPASLWEATVLDNCMEEGGIKEPQGPNFYDQSLVDGYNIPIGVHVSYGYNVASVRDAYSCQPSTIKAFPLHKCPFELRLYADQYPAPEGLVPVTSVAGRTIETSPCFKDPLNETCHAMVVACRALCKAFDQGWVGYYIDNVIGDQDVVNPYVTRPNGQQIRWADQFLPDGGAKCGQDAKLCKERPAWGAFRGDAYKKNGGNMKNLVCCDGSFSRSPYNQNDPVGLMCPTLGAGDPSSVFSDQRDSDLDYPQANATIRMSSQMPDWPLATTGVNYARLYKDESPDAYSWQYNDGTSTFQCCGKQGDSVPTYHVTFCPST